MERGVVSLATETTVLARYLFFCVGVTAFRTAPFDLFRLEHGDGAVGLLAQKADAVVGPLLDAGQVEVAVAVVARPDGVSALDGTDADEAGDGAAGRRLLQHVARAAQRARVAAAPQVALQHAGQHAGLVWFFIFRRRELLHPLQMFLHILLQFCSRIAVAPGHSCRIACPVFFDRLEDLRVISNTFSRWYRRKSEIFSKSAIICHDVDRKYFMVASAIHSPSRFSIRIETT